MKKCLPDGIIAAIAGCFVGGLGAKAAYVAAMNAACDGPQAGTPLCREAIAAAEAICGLTTYMCVLTALGGAAVGFFTWLYHCLMDPDPNPCPGCNGPGSSPGSGPGSPGGGPGGNSGNGGGGGSSSPPWSGTGNDFPSNPCPPFGPQYPGCGIAC